MYTVGHSNRSLREFLEILDYCDVSIIVDVHRFPTSRKFPYFKKEVLQAELPRHAVGYVWLGKELGGYRNGGYLKYMSSMEFSRGISRLVRIIELVRRGYVAVMCVERFWFKCHRRFIADALIRHGYEVVHVVDAGREVCHKFRGVGIK